MRGYIPYMTVNPLILAARKFFRSAHESINQVRKYTGEPYFNHPLAVAETVVEYGGTVDMEIIALGHDCLEDCFPLNSHYSPELIAREFGKNVLEGVVSLTNVFTRQSYPTWNRKKRHEAEAERLGGIAPIFATIKLADIKCNTADILVQDREFAKVYLREKAGEIKFLQHGDDILWHDLYLQIEKGLQSLETLA